MTLALMVYLAGVLSKFSGFLIGVGLLFTVITIIAALWCAFEDEPFKKALNFAYVAIAIWFVAVFVPSERTMYIMAGAYAAQQVAENPNVQKLSGKVITIIEKKLDEIIDDKVKQVEGKVEGSK